MMNEDLISRQDAIRVLADYFLDHTGTSTVNHMQRASVILNSVPSADRPTGKWVEQESNGIEKIYLCSYCKNYEAWGETEKTPYCPQCGARMEVEHE